MVASPPPPVPSLVTAADRYVVLLGPPDGSPPELSDETRWLIPTFVSNSMGAERLDTIQCRVDFAAWGRRLQNTTTPIGFHRQVELRRLDSDGDPTDIIAWGMLASDGQEIAIEEREKITARLDHFLFGNLLVDTPYWDPIGSAVTYVDLPLVFNPTIDEVYCPNKSDRLNVARGSSPIFYHPESHRLDQSQALQNQAAGDWLIKEAVHFLCWHLNPNQTYVLNPTIAELSSAFLSEAGFARLRNVHLKFGRSLPQLLDDLLTPLNFGWNVVHSINIVGSRETRFRFFERGAGPSVSLFMQPIGQTIDPTQTNLAHLNLDYDVAQLANKIIGDGEFKLYEATFPLVPAWDPAEDSTNVLSLSTGQLNSISRRDVGRKYVANEAGDYGGVNGRPWITRFDLTAISADFKLIRRRRFRRCISEHSSGDDDSSNNYALEWWDKNQSGATDQSPSDPGWVRSKHPFQILEKECGIMFSGAAPPNELLTLLVDNPSPGTQPVFLRITCAVESDVRLTYTADRRDSSPNGETVPMYLDLNDRFQFRSIYSSSRYYNVGPSDQKDDTDKLTTYVQKVRDNNDQAEVSLGVTLMTSNHPEYKIGCLVTGVTGRNLTFNANSASGTQRKLQIVGINRTLDGERRTELLLESFALEKRELQVDS